MNDGRDDAEPDLAGLARRFVELWESQVLALAADPQYAEMARRITQLALTQMSLQGKAGAAMMRMAAEMSDESQRGGKGGTSGNGAAPAGAAAGAAAAAAAPGGADPAVDEFAGRLADVERRLAELEGGPPK
ncbi:MAG: hypothetical protein WD270_05870 [Acetobacterales bacterium]